MPTSLTATKIKDTYGQVLHVDGGVTSTPKSVYDGDGTATALKVSTTAIEVPALTLSGGTANGVAYLNGSKVLTTGSALTFDGTNLGLGTTPVNAGAGYTNLSVYGSTSGFLDVKNTTVTGRFQANASDFDIGIIGAYPLRFTLNGSEQMRLTSTGLGIGTSSPSAKLDISGVSRMLFYVSGSDTEYRSVNAAGSAFAKQTYNALSYDWGLSNGFGNMVLDTSGNLGLGVTPSASGYKNFQINTTGIIGSNTGYVWFGNNWIYNGGDKYIANGYATLYGSNEGKHTWFTAPSGTAGNAISFTQAMTLDASGNLLLGTTSNTGVDTGTQRLVVTGIASGNGGALGLISDSVGRNIILTDSSKAVVSVYNVNSSVATIGTNTSNPLVFSTNATERMRIDSSGNLLVGTTSQFNVARFCIKNTAAANIAAFQNGDNGGYGINFLNVAGTQVGAITWTASATTYATSSDYRLKENIQPMQNALGVVAQLNPVTYTWKADGSEGQGFIAHELQAIVPDCVTGEKDAVDADGNPVYQGIDTSFLVATLTKAIQEQQEQINQLKAEVAALKGV